jgi:hypothetical protein
MPPAIVSGGRSGLSLRKLAPNFVEPTVAGGSISAMTASSSSSLRPASRRRYRPGPHFAGAGGAVVGIEARAADPAESDGRHAFARVAVGPTYPVGTSQSGLSDAGDQVIFHGAPLFG